MLIEYIDATLKRMILIVSDEKETRQEPNSNEKKIDRGFIPCRFTLIFVTFL